MSDLEVFVISVVFAAAFALGLFAVLRSAPYRNATWRVYLAWRRFRGVPPVILRVVDNDASFDEGTWVRRAKVHTPMRVMDGDTITVILRVRHDGRGSVDVTDVWMGYTIIPIPGKTVTDLR